MTLRGGQFLTSRYDAPVGHPNSATRTRAGAFGAMVIAYGAPSIAVVVYTIYWLLHLDAPGAYREALALLGNFGPYPFYDLDAVLSALDCARQGVDVTLPNACMGGDGLFQYSPLLLKMAMLPIGHAQYVPLGMGLDLLFLTSFFVLPRPRRWEEFALLLLALVSSNTLLAIESANIDVAVYLLVLGGVHLLLLGPRVRLAGYATLLGAAAIKFYPACLLVLAVRERPVRFLAIALACLAATLLLIVSHPSELGHILPNLPQGPPGQIFSARGLPLGLAFAAHGGDANTGLGLAVRLGSLVVLLGACAAITRRQMPAILPGFRVLPDRERLFLVTGAIAMAFCFFAAHNFVYREIFLIPTLPGLWALTRAAPDRARAQRFRIASWVVACLLWSLCFQVGGLRTATEAVAGMHAVQAAWLVRELCCWWLISLLLGVVLCFLHDAPALAGCRRGAAA